MTRSGADITDADREGQARASGEVAGEGARGRRRASAAFVRGAAAATVSIACGHAYLVWWPGALSLALWLASLAAMAWVIGREGRR